MNKTAPQRELVKLLQANARSMAVCDVFRDFLEMAALAIANAVDLHQATARETRYLAIINRYQADERHQFPRMLALLVESMEAKRDDVMGTIMGELQLGNAARGQFFTPYAVCQLMARAQVGDGKVLREEIARKGYITVNEPAVGGGAMVIAFAEAMQEAGIDYQHHLHVIAQDVDARSVHMAFLQFSLLHIPATVILGNSLALEEREHWHTPAHFMGLWDHKLRRGYALGSVLDGTAPPAPVAVPIDSPIRLQGDLFACLEQAA